MKEERITVSKREQLVKESDAYRDAIKNQVQDIKTSAEQWAKTVLIIGGTIVLAYTFVKTLLGKGKSNENTNLPATTSERHDYGIFNKVMEQIAFFLMAIAREKLMEFLKSYGKTGETDTE